MPYRAAQIQLFRVRILIRPSTNPVRTMQKEAVMTMNPLDAIQARADAATKRLAAWDERPDRVSFREFSAVDNGAIRVRTLHLSCESALLASAENANETIPKLIAALRAVMNITAREQAEHRASVAKWGRDLCSGSGEAWVSEQIDKAVREALG